MNASSRDQRLSELLCDEATEGLQGSRHSELQLLKPSADERYSFALAAALLDRVFSHPEAQPHAEPLPTHLRRAILEQSQSTPLASTRHEIAAPERSAPVDPRGPASPRSLLGWYVAAAALILAAVGWLGDRPGDNPAAERRQRLLASVPSDALVRADWGALEDARFAAVRGDVVWSSESQEGYMRLSGLPLNEPLGLQYQLWIVDPSRDTEPVDGGVFDFQGGEQVIAIDAKLRVEDPRAFVLTLEQPGGVVVSATEHLVLAAPE